MRSKTQFAVALLVALTLLVGLACAPAAAPTPTAPPAKATAAPAATPTAAPAAKPTEAPAAKPTPAAAVKPTKSPYKIGASIALTGAGAPLGVPEKRGIELAVELINAAGGINGHPLQAIIEDDETKPDKALGNANKLIFQDKVVAIIGGSNGGSTLAIGPVAEKNKIPQIACTGTVDPVEDTYTYEFHVAPVQDLNAEANLAYIANVLKAKKLAVLHADDAYGVTAIPGINKSKDKYGITVVADEKYAMADTDMSVQWTKIKGVNPDAALLWGSGSPPIIAIKNAKSLAAPFPVVGALGMATQAFLDGAGEAAEGVVIPGFIIGDDPLPRQKALTDAYKAKGYALPSFYDAMGWDATWMIANALKTLGDVETVDTAKLRDAIEAGKYTGVIAEFAFTPKDHTGIKISDYVYMKAEKGKWVRMK